ncbi:hypothetical protein [Alkalihalobacillus sp. TS-13]|nr:hypothetical protein [Alkalihalobacillus sp. TS-13]
MEKKVNQQGFVEIYIIQWQKRGEVERMEIIFNISLILMLVYFMYACAFD